MYAIEFETDMDNEFIRVPEFEKLKNKHVRVIVLADESDVATISEQQFDPNEMQAIVDQARSSGVSKLSLQQIKQQFIAKHAK